MLVGTDSVAESEALSQRLAEAGLPHAVLNARQDGDEAEIVARAGARGAITVATNMAGRGTDIPLGRGRCRARRAARHLLPAQRRAPHRPAARRPLRAPGRSRVVETWLSLDSALLARTLPRRLATMSRVRNGKLPATLVKILSDLPQRLTERRHFLQRKRMFEHDQRLDRQLSFGGPGK